MTKRPEGSASWPPEGVHVGPHTREWVLWPTRCHHLADYNIGAIGTTYARHPYTIRRHSTDFSHFLISLEGSGEVWVDDRWQICGPNHVYLCPPGVNNIFRCGKKGVWKFCWAHYLNPAADPMIQQQNATLSEINPRPIAACIGGLYEEFATSEESPATLHWIELAHFYILQIVSRGHQDERLWRLWRACDAAIGEPWDIERMCKVAGLSREHLRRLCARDIRRSPMRQLAHLRMQHAAMLLETGSLTVESAAERVGYPSPAAFSDAFRRHMGLRPGEYRKRFQVGP